MRDEVRLFMAEAVAKGEVGKEWTRVGVRGKEVDGSDTEGDEGINMSGGSWLCAAGLLVIFVTALFVLNETEHVRVVHLQLISPEAKVLSFLYLNFKTSNPSFPLLVFIFLIFMIKNKFG